MPRVAVNGISLHYEEAGAGLSDARHWGLLFEADEKAGRDQRPTPAPRGLPLPSSAPDVRNRGRKARRARLGQT